MYNFKEHDIIFLLGAGASADAKIPVSSRMVNDIEGLLDSSKWNKFKDLYYLIKSGVNYSAGLSGKTAIFNVETLLFVLEELVQKENHLLYPFIGSWNVRFNEVVKDNFSLIEEFQKEIKEKLKEWVTIDDYRMASYFKYFKKLKDELTFPIRVFTLNYDKCIEENSNNPGFEFTYERGFDKDKKYWNHKLFSDIVKDEEKDIFLYKMHGSIDWKRDEKTNRVKYVDREPTEPDLIFGTQNKVQFSDPYLYLFSDFRHYSLNAKLIVCIGYSFSDVHINGLIGQALKQDNNTRLLSVGLFSEEVDIYKKMISNNIDFPAENIDVEKTKAKDFFKNKLNRKYFSKILPKESGENVFDI